MNWWLIAVLTLASYSIFITFFCIKFGLTILRIQDSVESSLDKIDTRYASISEILERPLFYDSPEIRRVLDDVTVTRESILEIANSLSKDFNQDDSRDIDEG